MGYPIEKFRNKFRWGVPPYAHFRKKGVEDRGGDPPLEGGTPHGKSSGGVGVEDRGVPPGLGGTPPMRVQGFLGWGAGFFWGVPRVFIDALDR